MEKYRLSSFSTTTFFSELEENDFTFIAAVSFEERATAWAEALSHHNLLPQEAILMQYNTQAEPEREDQRMRERCRSDFHNAFLASARFSDPINPFALSVLKNYISNELATIQTRILVVDITCMTRIHHIALVNSLSQSINSEQTIFFCYATPDSYGFESGITLGWKDVLFVPMGLSQGLRREGHARGLILAGHYGERLSVALQEIEPAYGTLVYTKTIERPDIVSRARQANDFVEARLLDLRVPRTGHDNGDNGHWQAEVVDLEDLDYMTNITDREVLEAKIDKGPIMVFPFGPKPLALSVLLRLSSQPESSAWTVYPVPERFDAWYSVGVDELKVYRLQKD